jgi:glutamate synthase (ferredoxin)
MSGGIAFVFDETDEFPARCNRDMVSLQTLTDPVDINMVRGMIQRHIDATQSDFARKILNHWEDSLPRFVCVVPNDYARMLQLVKEAEAEGLSGDEAVMATFALNSKDVARVSGN